MTDYPYSTSAIRPQYSVAVAHAAEPVSYDEAADHCRVDSDDDKAYLTALICVAREYVERVTGRATMKATWKAVAPRWGSFSDAKNALAFPLFRTPLVSISSVYYYAPGAAETTEMTSTLYSAITTTEPGSIYIPGDLPDVDEDRPDAIQISFIAGHSTASAVPPIMRHAIKLLVAHLYEQRVPIQSGGSISAIPYTLGDMIRNQRVGGHFA